MKTVAPALALALLAGLRPVAAPGADAGCAIPASVTMTARPLPHVAAALRPGGQLDILALGSASLTGPRGGVAGSVPERLMQDLRKSVPDATIRLTLRAGRTESAKDMLTALLREVNAHRYQLVLWQSGTVEALHREPPEQFRRTLAAGVAAATATGADLVLIDMQWSELIDQHADLQPYRAAMIEAALKPGVMLFPRYALTHAWAEAGQFDIEAIARPERRRAAARLRECLGDALARMVLDAARARSP